jgi:hypothetical protein
MVRVFSRKNGGTFLSSAMDDAKVPPRVGFFKKKIMVTTFSNFLFLPNHNFFLWSRRIFLIFFG